ncbi:MAG: isoprenylcysteine carboxylmethyltransferase family protein [Gammaproteobacteria bacterium]|nr:MAG: isoprenylcysteine carboxylmethyltransferase family protein [Gammaproteobacteria bacterium]
MVNEDKPVITVRTWVSLVVRTSLFPVAILWPAGTWKWWDAWLLIGIWILFFITITLLLVKHDPALLVERMKASPIQKDQKGWDKFLLAIIFVVGICLYIVPGFELIRFEWNAPLPRWLRTVALLAHIPGFYLLGWVMLSNTYLSQVVKIDHDRGHQVITGGPYAIVRHPMYLSVIVLLLAYPLALGSSLGLIPALLLIVLFIIRTILEDRTLHSELAGYPDYAKVTRYKILPWIW